ncbi:hypothetical protein F5051DRAFT_59449 [Lentinula edodes]|nr:hypothetical protein F5051DRAFT_59449 [Lentinula edodes]
MDDTILLRDHHRLPTLSDDVSPLVFAAMRLGARQGGGQYSKHRIPSGRTLDQDSMLCHLLDVAPSLSNRSDNENAYHFVSRCITPTAVPILHRFLHTQPGNDSTPHSIDLISQEILSIAVKTLSRLRDQYGTEEMLATPHMLAMPIDFFLGIQSSVSDPGYAHQTALNILRLVVGVVLSKPSKPALDKSFASSDKRMQRTMVAIDNLLKEAYGAGTLGLQLVSSLDSQTLPLMCELIEHTQYLTGQMTWRKAHLSVKIIGVGGTPKAYVSDSLRRINSCGLQKRAGC